MQSQGKRKTSDLRFALGISLGLHVLVFALFFGLHDESSIGQSTEHGFVASLSFVSSPSTTSSGMAESSDSMVMQESSPSVPASQTADLNATTPARIENVRNEETSTPPGEPGLPDDRAIGAEDPSRAGQARNSQNTEHTEERQGGFEQGQHVQLPRPAEVIEPTYPLIARRRGIEGVVVIQVIVSPTGEQLESTVIYPSDHDLLNEAAIRAVNSARFVPGTVDNRPTEMSVLVRIVFALS